jgi:hypothetical protein
MRNSLLFLLAFITISTKARNPSFAMSWSKWTRPSIRFDRKELRYFPDGNTLYFFVMNHPDKYNG